MDHIFEGNADQRSTRVSVHLISRLRSPPWKIWGSHLSAQRRQAPFFFSAPHSAHTPERGRQPWRRRGFDAKRLRSSSDAQIGWPSWSGGEELMILCWIMSECIPLELLVELPAQTVHLIEMEINLYLQTQAHKVTAVFRHLPVLTPSNLPWT